MKRKIFKNKKRKEPPKPQTVRGIVSMSASGFGFLSVEGVERDYFIPQQFIGAAMDRDTVEAELLPDRRSDGFIAKVTNVLQRGRKSLCGVLLAGGRIRPFSRKIPFDLTLAGSHSSARKGDWIEVEFDGDESRGARLRKVIGKAGNIQADISAIVSEYDLPPPYSEEEEEAAKRLRPVGIPREQFSGRCILTIDPSDAKDHDDAVSVEMLPGGNYELGVHIADVACFVPRGSRFDACAYERAFTSYLPGRTLPMLPRGLTRAISLSPDANSFAHSIVMEVDGRSGELLSSRRIHTEIRVSARLSFDDVEFFIENGKLPERFGGDPSAGPVLESLARAVDLFRMMRKRRAEEEEFLEIETEFVRAVCDEGAASVALLKKEIQRNAEKLVEEFMLAANVEAAKEMLEKSVPGLFRVHPAPLPDKSVEFCDFVRNVCGFSPGDISSRKVCCKFLRAMPADHRKPVLTEAFLRAMARAFYSESNALHFGLGKSRYSHFTSPIRRYPDLVVHQQLLSLDGHGKARSRKELASVAAHCSVKESLNDESFWAANDILKLHYLKDMIINGGNLFFEAVISKIGKSGLLVAIPEMGIRGEIPEELLAGSGLARKRGSGRMEKGRKNYRCGDYIAVRLANVDMPRGRAVFQPA